MKKDLLLNGGLVLGSLILTLILLEGVAQIATKPVYPILRTDSAVGTIMEPNVRKYLWHDEAQKEVLVITNDLGYVGTSLPETSTNTLRIALLGDSTTASIEVDYFNSYPFLLEQTLNTSRPVTEKPVRIWNYGVGGTGTFLQYQRYKKHVAPYNPDYVALMFSENDYSDNLNKIQFDPEKYEEAKTRNIFWKNFLLKWQLPKFIFVKLQHNTNY